MILVLFKLERPVDGLSSIGMVSSTDDYNQLDMMTRLQPYIPSGSRLLLAQIYQLKPLLPNSKDGILAHQVFANVRVPTAQDALLLAAVKSAYSALCYAAGTVGVAPVPFDEFCVSFLGQYMSEQEEN